MIAFTGPSGALDTRTADVQRSINLYPSPIESGSGKARFMLKSIQGLIQFADLGTIGRGAYEINSRAWAVVDVTLWEIFADGTSVSRGTLVTSTGYVSISSNTVQLYLTDGPNGYRLTLATNDFAQITDPDFPGSELTDYLDQYAIFAPAGRQSFYITAVADAGAVDALDFASAESMPDYLVGHIVVNRQLWLFGADGGEVWDNTGNSEFPIERNNGSIFGVGCSAKWTIQRYNNTVAWLGSDKAGGDGIWMAQGYRAVRISTASVEQAIARCTDLTLASAYVRRVDGSVLYCLYLPGVDTTWCFDALVGAWHEECDFPDGAYTPHRVRWHIGCFGKELGLGDDGVIYEWSKTTYRNAGDTLVRDRISPHNAVPDNKRVFYSDFHLDLDTGIVGDVMLRYSDDGGANWGFWDTRSLGGVGNYEEQVRWLRCGSARDRVWWVRCADNVPFNPVNATVKVAQ